MKNDVKIDRAARRVTMRCEGQWTLALANRWYADMAEIHRWTRLSPEPITALANLDGLKLHTQEVSRRIEQSVLLMEEFPFERYALIVPSYLMRMQCRRLISNIEHCYFESVEQAMVWLGWERGYKQALAA